MMIQAKQFKEAAGKLLTIAKVLEAVTPEEAAKAGLAAFVHETKLEAWRLINGAGVQAKPARKPAAKPAPRKPAAKPAKPNGKGAQEPAAPAVRKDAPVAAPVTEQPAPAPVEVPAPKTTPAQQKQVKAQLGALIEKAVAANPELAQHVKASAERAEKKTPAQQAARRRLADAAKKATANAKKAAH
jgi:hypothetical protein